MDPKSSGKPRKVRTLSFTGIPIRMGCFSMRWYKEQSAGALSRLLTTGKYNTFLNDSIFLFVVELSKGIESGQFFAIDASIDNIFPLTSTSVEILINKPPIANELL